jgi:tetraacyldisaccharide 4'-kinase
VSAAKARIEARWLALAQRRGTGARLLLPLAGLYGLVTGVRRWLYRTKRLPSHRLPVPVVVVGNVVVGGAGKTPTTIALVRHLRSAGWTPGVVSRGHGRRTSAPLEVLSGIAATDCGDEPKLIHQTTGVPVFVSSDRIQAGRCLLAAHPETDVIVCDDGLQHLAMQRDLSIVVFDDRGMGNGWLLPAGLLREPWPPHATPSGPPPLVLRQYRVGHVPSRVPTPPETEVFDARRTLAGVAINLEGRRVPLSDLQGRTLVGLAGIARPDVFFGMVRSEGLALVKEISLPDHAPPADYLPHLQHDAQAFICTEKDAVKLMGLHHPAAARIWSVGLELAVDDAFFATVDARLPGPPKRP